MPCGRVLRHWASRRRLARLAVEVRDHDGVELALRIGLNSGQVIAGEIGSASLGYTTIGEQVGMAQRMESVAPPGGVMLSASTARLVDGAAVLSEPEMVRIKGADEAGAGLPPVGHARRIGRSGAPSRAWWVGAGRWPPSRACWTAPSTATARWSAWWVHRASGRAVWCVRSAAMAAARGVEVFTAYCESHASRHPVSCGGAAAARGHRRRGS